MLTDNYGIQTLEISMSVDGSKPRLSIDDQSQVILQLCLSRNALLDDMKVELRRVKCSHRN
jgi:hypothetical protein